jgi:cholesterol transport system auxiliary component
MKANKPAVPSSRAGLACACLLALGACGVIPKREPTVIYEPARPAAVQHADWPQVNWSLVVAKPVASALIDNDRIAVRPASGEITVYKASAWTDPAPDLVQNALLRRFEDSGKILSVSRPGAGVRGEYQLQTDLRTFDSVYTSPGRAEARVEIYARLVSTADGQVVAARAFSESEAAASEDVSAVADAFSRALGRATENIAGWTLTSGARRN